LNQLDKCESIEKEGGKRLNKFEVFGFFTVRSVINKSGDGDNIMKGLIRIFFIFVFLLEVVFTQTEKDRDKAYRQMQDIPRDQRWPGIVNYPRAVREWDSLIVEVYKFRTEVYQKGSNIPAREVDMPMNLLLPAARAHISARLFLLEFKK